MRVVRKSEQGYLLMEAVVAIFIVSIALVAISGMFTLALKAITSADEYTTITSLAQQQMDFMLTKDDLFWENANFPYQIGPEPLPGTGHLQTVRAEISDADPEFPIKQRLIKLTVQVERTGGGHVTLVTYVLRELPQFPKIKP